METADELKLKHNIERFRALMRSVTTQQHGIERLVNWLEANDFYKAPASTRYHGAYEGGLLEHSLNVYDAFMKLFSNDGYDNDTIIICTLLHDVCKVGFYTTELRNKKDENGKWVKVPVYVIEDQFPYGHGEKSVYIINSFIHLKTEEAMAIRWHMGGFDDAVKGGSYTQSTAFSKFPLAVKLHIADLYASYLLESRGDQFNQQVVNPKATVIDIPKH